MKRFWQHLVAMLAASAYAEIEGVEMEPATETKNPVYFMDAEQLSLQQI